MLIRSLPLVAALLPVVGVFAAYWLNVQAGNLTSCMPFWDGCTSISATGRYAPGNIPFRAALLPQASVLVFFWWFSVEWLRFVSPTTRSGTVIKISGVTGAAALILYVVFLGTQQPFYEFMRRFGVYFYFLGTAIAQVALTLALAPSRNRLSMMWLALTPFGLGVINLAEKVVRAGPSSFQNRVEWIAALLMQIWFIAFFQIWRRSDFRVRFRFK